MEQQFNKGGIETSYKMTKKPTKGGVVQSHTGRSVNLMKNRRNRTRHLVLLFLIAFIMLSPQVRENLFEKWAPGIQEYWLGTFADSHLYPNEATFTIARSIAVQNSNSNGWVNEDIVIPSDVESLHNSANDFLFTDGEMPSPTDNIQKVDSVNVHFSDGTMCGNSPCNHETFSIPIDGTRLSYENRINSTKGHSIWWPGYGGDNHSCQVGNCVKMMFDLQPGEAVVYVFEVTITSTSYSWWDASRVDSRVAGTDEGINVDNSGTFSDVENRGDGQKFRDFTNPKWYDRGIRYDKGTGLNVDNGYAMNSQEAIVIETAEQISSSLPEGLRDNAYAFSRAAFDYLHKNVEYDKFAPVIARSGPQCLADDLGDCDEQTNAFLSLLRVKGLPGWYVFGALADSEYKNWEGHAWGYILLPMSDSWCNDRNIKLDSCYVEASVDVVNNKWLLHTPNAYISWIEEPDATGTLLNNYYSPATVSSSQVLRIQPVYTTFGEVDTNGGLFQVKILEENLR